MIREREKVILSVANNLAKILTPGAFQILIDCVNDSEIKLNLDTRDVLLQAFKAAGLEDYVDSRPVDSNNEWVITTNGMGKIS